MSSKMKILSNTCRQSFSYLRLKTILSWTCARVISVDDKGLRWLLSKLHLSNDLSLPISALVILSSDINQLTDIDKSKHLNSDKSRFFLYVCGKVEWNRRAVIFCFILLYYCELVKSNYSHEKKLYLFMLAPNLYEQEKREFSFKQFCFLLLTVSRYGCLHW